MKANIKLQWWIPLIFIVVVGFFLTQDFNVLDVVMIIGGLIIVGYFVLGFVKRKGALVIEKDQWIVTTPFKKKEYTISEITDVCIKPNDPGVLQGTIDGETINLCTNIYDKDVDDILHYLKTHYEHLA